MSNKKQCTCDIPFSDCPYAMEFPHGDKWYCTLPKPKEEMQENKTQQFNPSERPKLQEDGDLMIVKLTIDGEQYDGFYEDGWWVHYGGLSVGYRNIDENEIEYWTY